MHKLPHELGGGQRFRGDFLMDESKKLWGGRFAGKTDPGFAEFNNSFRFDRRLFSADVTASIAYCEALERAGVLTADEDGQIRRALRSEEHTSELQSRGLISY